VSENRRPSAEEITKIKIPYLDAVIEEIVRTSLTAPGVSRRAMVETELLGYHIPKGTDVFIMGNGPDFFKPAFQVDEEARSATCRAARGKIGFWTPDDMNLFKPERWLSTDDEGNEIFDPTAGPHLVFGLGPRGCFGRRMAYLEIRLILVLLIWEFELKKVPQELGGYDAFDKMTRQPQKCYVRLGVATI
jgi:cytochrome P450